MWAAGVWGNGPSYSDHYKQLEPDTYYIKLDDDIMFIRDGAMEAMLAEKLRNRFLFVSANVINHSLLTHVSSLLVLEQCSLNHVCYK